MGMHACGIVCVTSLEGEGYTVCRAHNDYEGLPFARTGCMALPTRPIQYIVIV